MAFIGDMKKILLLLKLTNFAESLPESKTHLHVWRISYLVTILEDEGSADDVVNHSEPFSEEDQKVLNWQDVDVENLQDDIGVRNALSQFSGKICPYKNISTSLYDKVKSDENTQQKTIGNRPLSSYRHLSFRSAMLTKHSARDEQADGQPELLFQHDGLGEDQSYLRWRSHDYIKVTLCKPRPYFRVFWLIQWDLVDLLCHIGSLPDATNHGKRRRSPAFHQDSMKRPGDSEKFNGVRLYEKRKSPWVAEMRPEGTRDKLWLGSYKTKEAAARAADAGYHYYNKLNKLNFRDSPQLLKQIPAVLVDKGKQEFVKKEARRLAELSEKLTSTWDPRNRYCNTSTEGFTASHPWDIVGSGSNYAADNMQPATNDNFVGLPSLDDVPPLLDSLSDPETNLDVQPSTSYGSDGLLQETVGSSPEENGWLSTQNNGSFTANSQVRAGVLYPPLEQADIYQHTLSPVGNCSSESEEPTDTMFNVFTSTLWGENLELDIPCDIAGDIAGYNSGRGAESVQAEPNGDWERDIAEDFFGHWSMVQI